ncbi:MAG: hypothetical protein M1834_008590 [Cirrosporium novae-zelandiae]|nr:MAG: hypothetical protein M1834_008590 [Cirrosporium novae-zelandiae]
MDSPPSDRIVTTQEEVNRILRLRKKHRQPTSCYPCRQRKVKCDNHQPCLTCSKRGHPEICSYNPARKNIEDAGRAGLTRGFKPGNGPETSSQNASYHDNNAQFSGSPKVSNSFLNVSSRPSPNNMYSNNPEVIPTQNRDDARATRQSLQGGCNDYSYTGANSTASFVRFQARDANHPLAQEIEPVLGLRNTYERYPFMETESPEEQRQTLSRLLPDQKEVLRLFQFYRNLAFPFNPILVDIDGFESDLCIYLEDLATNKFGEHAAERPIAQIGLLLATLASGAQFSDMNHHDRMSSSQDFARRSFHCLRLANFLCRPSLDSVQALLVLGNVLQNNGQSDAAWTLLGSTVRLAQTLGIHTERGIRNLPENLRIKSRKLWFNVVWQDSLLCLCFDRPPAVAMHRRDNPIPTMDPSELSYTDAMYHICDIGLGTVVTRDSPQFDVNQSLQALLEIDDLRLHVKPHLQSKDNCKTFQQHFEYFAFRLHTSFLASVICRPAIRHVPSSQEQSKYTLLVERAKISLVNTAQAFLVFQSLSIVPLRTWSMIHSGLSSALLLGLWRETRDCPESRDLQRGIFKVFSSQEGEATETEILGDPNCAWLSKAHIRALLALRSVIHDEQVSPTVMSNNQPSQQNAASQSSNAVLEDETVRGDLHTRDSNTSLGEFMPGFPPSMDVTIGQNTLDFPVGVSPLSYFESIMQDFPYPSDGPLFAIGPQQGVGPL